MLPFPILDKEATLSLIDFPGMIFSAEDAFISQSQGIASPPGYINMPIGENFAHYKAGYKLGSTTFAIKYSGGFWGNAKNHLPVDYGYVIVHDAETGKPTVMFCDEGTITDYRTAAAGAVAAKYASNVDATHVGIIGTGVQAHLQLEALLFVRPSIQTVTVWGHTPDHVGAYVTDMKKKLPQLTYQACSTPKEASSHVDILITATPSRSPIVQSEWISPGTHITAVGACAPYMQEHDPKTLAKATYLFVDSIEKASMDGEIHHGLDAGTITRALITGELGDLIRGTVHGRSSQSDITFVDLVGLGIQDATAAAYLYTKYLASTR
jgi:ornithine cyclodeaminase